MASTYKELRRLSEDQLVQQYDDMARSTQIGLDFLREEIARRTTEKQTEQTLAATRQMRTLTIVIGILTLVNVITVVIQVFCAR